MTTTKESGGVTLSDDAGDIVHWDVQEWKDDPEVEQVIIAAMRVLISEGSRALRKRIERA